MKKRKMTMRELEKLAAEAMLTDPDTVFTASCEATVRTFKVLDTHLAENKDKIDPVLEEVLKDMYILFFYVSTALCAINNSKIPIDQRMFLGKQKIEEVFGEDDTNDKS